jgi:hypothetical protein
MRTLATVIGIAGLILVSTASAQETEWESLNQEVMQLYGTGEYDRAVVVAEKARSIGTKRLKP